MKSGAIQSMPIAIPSAPSGGGGVTNWRFDDLPGDGGRALVFSRPLADGAERWDGWPLSGGVWDLGARQIPQALPEVADQGLLPFAVSVAEQLKNEGQNAAQFVASVQTDVGLDHRQLFAIFGMAMELLGVSNRQVSLYAKTTFQMVATLGQPESSALLVQALRVRAAIDPLVQEADACAAGLGPQMTSDGARASLVQGGLDAGLSGADAEKNASWLLEQLGVFNAPAASGKTPSSASAEDLRSGWQTLSSQHSVAPAGRQPMAGPRVGNKRSRTDSSMEGLDEEVSRLRARTRSFESFGAYWVADKVPGPVSRMPLAAGAAQASPLPWLAAVVQKLVECEQRRVGYFPRSAFEAWIGLARCSGLVSAEVTRNAFHRAMYSQAAMGKLDALPLLRDEALVVLQDHLNQHQVLPEAAAFQSVAAARFFPLPDAVAWDAAAADRGRVLFEAAGGVVIAYPAHLDLSGATAENTAQAMSAMLRLGLRAYLCVSLAQKTGRVPLVSLADLAAQLREVVSGARYSPRTHVELLTPLDEALSLVWLQQVVLDGLSDALAARVLGMPAANAPASDMDWDTLVSRALDKVAYQPAIYEGLIGGDARAQSVIFQSISKTARGWLDGATPRFKEPGFQPVADELAALANDASGGRARVTRAEVITKLENHFQDLIAAHTRPDSPKLRGHKAVAYLRRALLVPLHPGEAAQSADSFFGSSVLALVSGHEGASLKLLEKLRDEARRSPEAFVSDFLGDA